MIGAYVQAGWSTLGFALIFSGVLKGMIGSKSDEQALGALMMIFILVPSIIGTCLGFSAMDRRLPASMAVWIATIWNGIILACFGLLVILGLTRR